MRRGIPLIVIGTLALALATSAAARPVERSFYAGETADGNKLRLQITRRSSGKLYVKIRRLDDGCFGDTLEFVAARVRNNRFSYDESGNTNSVGYAAQADGRFTSSKRATVTTHSAAGDLFGTPPGTANICEVTATFQLAQTGHQKFLKTVSR